MIAVYFLKMASGRIIYVGCSGQPLNRFLQHRPKGWLGLVSDIKVKWYEDRPRAELAEARFIRRFRPRYNKVHNPDYTGVRAKPTKTLSTAGREPPVINRWGGYTYGISNSSKKAPDGGLPAWSIFHDEFYGSRRGLNLVRKVMRKGDSLRLLQGYTLPEGFVGEAALDGIHVEHVN